MRRLILDVLFILVAIPAAAVAAAYIFVATIGNLVGFFLMGSAIQTQAALLLGAGAGATAATAFVVGGAAVAVIGLFYATMSYYHEYKYHGRKLSSLLKAALCGVLCTVFIGIMAATVVNPAFVPVAGVMMTVAAITVASIGVVKLIQHRESIYLYMKSFFVSKTRTHTDNISPSQKEVIKEVISASALVARQEAVEAQQQAHDTRLSTELKSEIKTMDQARSTNYIEAPDLVKSRKDSKACEKSSIGNR